MSYKPKIIALCGMSGAGKTYMARELYHAYLREYPAESINLMISDTTRTMRKGEYNGVSYNFITKDEFLNNVKNDRYMEHVKFFNGQWYGSLAPDKKYDINIGVFNLAGLAKMSQWQDDYEIFIIFLDVEVRTRLDRIEERNGFGFEALRRSFADIRDYNKYIPKINKLYANVFSIEASPGERDINPEGLKLITDILVLGLEESLEEIPRESEEDIVNTQT